MKVTEGQGQERYSKLQKMLPLFLVWDLIHIHIISVSEMVSQEVDLPYKVQKVPLLKVKVTEGDRKYLSRHFFRSVTGSYFYAEQM